MNLPIRVPGLIQSFYSDRIWKMRDGSKKLYLTFDDGPHPEITRLVLVMLNRHKAKGTFFCIGKRVVQYPEVVTDILDQGSAIGNHSFSHLNGWNTSTSEYVDDVCAAEKHIDSRLFRAPYGRIKNSQAIELKKRGFQLVMWSVLSQDYDSSLTPEQCAERSVKRIEFGDIVLFHDSEKAKRNMLAGLEAVLNWGEDNGVEFDTLEFQKVKD
jgi:peptidoglycan/xylan/chitin deacetylase (PgdA/CDA1 family)